MKCFFCCCFRFVLSATIVIFYIYVQFYTVVAARGFVIFICWFCASCVCILIVQFFTMYFYLFFFLFLFLSIVFFVLPTVLFILLEFAISDLSQTNANASSSSSSTSLAHIHTFTWLSFRTTSPTTMKNFWLTLLNNLVWHKNKNKHGIKTTTTTTTLIHSTTCERCKILMLVRCLTKSKKREGRENDE